MLSTLSLNACSERVWLLSPHIATTKFRIDTIALHAQYFASAHRAVTLFEAAAHLQIVDRASCGLKTLQANSTARECRTFAPDLAALKASAHCPATQVLWSTHSRLRIYHTQTQAAT